MGIGPPFCFRVIPTYRVLSHSDYIFLCPSVPLVCYSTVACTFSAYYYSVTHNDCINFISHNVYILIILLSLQNVAETDDSTDQ